MSSQLSRFDLPGFTLPLDYTVSLLEGHSYISFYNWLIQTARIRTWPKSSFPHSSRRRSWVFTYVTVDDIQWLTYDFRIVYVYREILMMRVMNTITDKPGWDQKVGHSILLRPFT